MTLHSWLISIGDEAFARCCALRELELPEGLLSIGNHAFEGIEFRNLVLPSSLQIIGEQAFSQFCSMLVHADSYGEEYAQSNHLPYNRFSDDYSISEAEQGLGG